MTNLRADLDREDCDSLDIGLTDGYEFLDQMQPQLDEAIRLYRDEGYSLSKAALSAGVGVLHLMDEIERRELQLIGSEELAEASARAIAEAFDDPGFLELFQRGKERLAAQRSTKALERIIAVPPLSETQARALVTLIDREQRTLTEQKMLRRLMPEPGTIPPSPLSESVREELAALKERLLQALGQGTAVQTR